MKCTAVTGDRESIGIFESTGADKLMKRRESADLRCRTNFPLTQSHLSGYRLAAGTFAASGAAVGIVATFALDVDPVVPVAAAGVVLAGINPSVLRTSSSSFASVSLLSFRNWRAFSRPWPMRSFL